MIRSCNSDRCYYNIKFFAVDVATIYNEIIIICLEDCSKLQDDLRMNIDFFYGL